jgi:abequosyltransferase
MKSLTTEILLSICIPTYNRAHKLRLLLQNIEECFDTASVEICISDNKSTDNTEEVIKEFSKKFINFKYQINIENKGMAFNWINVTKMATGRYISVVSDEDSFLAEYSNKIFPILKENIYSIVFYRVLNNSTNDIWAPSVFNYKKIEHAAELANKIELFKYLHISGYVFKKSLISFQKVDELYELLPKNNWCAPYFTYNAISNKPSIYFHPDTLYVCSDDADRGYKEWKNTYSCFNDNIISDSNNHEGSVFLLNQKMILYFYSYFFNENRSRKLIKNLSMNLQNSLLMIIHKTHIADSDLEEIKKEILLINKTYNINVKVTKNIATQFIYTMYRLLSLLKKKTL